MIKFNTHFIPSREDSALRKIATLISVVGYANKNRSIS